MALAHRSLSLGQGRWDQMLLGSQGTGAYGRYWGLRVGPPLEPSSRPPPFPFRGEGGAPAAERRAPAEKRGSWPLDSNPPQ